MRFRAYTNGGYGFKGIDAAGGTMTLPIKLLAQPSGPMDAVNRAYVEQAASSLDAGNLVGGLTAARLPGFTGTDVSSAGGGVFTLGETGVTPGTYSKVTVDAKGRVTMGAVLTPADIPALTWSKVTNKPTTMAGYGITDIVPLGGGAMTGPLLLPQPPSAAGQLANKGYVDGKISASAGSAFVTGDIVSKGGATAPMGFLRCNGGDVAKSVYPALYAVVGDKYSNSSLNPGTTAGSGKPWRQQYDFNNSQSDDISNWTEGSPLPGYRSYAQAVVTKDKVYLIGGHDGLGVVGSSYMSTIATDGTLGSWTTLTGLPLTLAYSEAVVISGDGGVNPKLYMFGGMRTSGHTENVVYAAPIAADGSLGGWSSQSTLPVAFSKTQVIVTKKRVHVLSVNETTTVYTAAILADGSLGVWTTGTPLPTMLYHGQTAVTKTRVYLMGGLLGAASAGSSVVYTASILPDGTLGPWVVDTPLPEPLYGHQVVVVRNKVYCIGGIGGLYGSSFRNSVYSAQIRIDGTLGNWITNTSLPETVAFSQAIVTKNKLYLLGGHHSGSFSNKIKFTSFNGGYNDYSSFHTGSFSSVDPANFRLPDLSAKDKPGSYSYIKT